MKIYIDESNNSHCVLLNKSGKLNYGLQRYFGLGFLIEPSEAMISEYEKFISIYSNGFELKGNSLLSRKMNDAFDFYIKNILNNNYYVCVYDKKFLLSSSLILGLMCDFKNSDVYCLISDLCLEEDNILENYISFLLDLSKEKYNEFLQYLLEYDYKNESLKSFFLELIPSIIKENDYEGNKKFFPEVEKEDNKIMINFINLNALGESLLVIKEKYNLKNEDIYLIHDHLENYEDSIKSGLNDVNITNVEFKDSKECVELQMVDNCVSVIAKVVGCLTNEYIGDNPFDGHLNFELLILKKILSKISINDIKFCVELRHWAAIVALSRTMNDNDENKYAREKNLVLAEILENINEMPSNIEALEILKE